MLTTCPSQRCHLLPQAYSVALLQDLAPHSTTHCTGSPSGTRFLRENGFLLYPPAETPLHLGLLTSAGRVRRRSLASVSRPDAHVTAGLHELRCPNPRSAIPTSRSRCGHLSQNLNGRLPASLRPVKVGIETESGQGMPDHQARDQRAAFAHTKALLGTHVPR